MGWVAQGTCWVDDRGQGWWPVETVQWLLRVHLRTVQRALRRGHGRYLMVPHATGARRLLATVLCSDVMRLAQHRLVRRVTRCARPGWGWPEEAYAALRGKVAHRRQVWHAKVWPSYAEAGGALGDGISAVAGDPGYDLGAGPGA